MSDIESLFTELFNKYYNSLINYCIAKNIREQDADDIVSEAFARAYEKSNQLFPLNEKQQRAWLYSAVSLIIKEELSKTNLQLSVNSISLRTMRKRKAVLTNSTITIILIPVFAK